MIRRDLLKAALGCGVLSGVRAAAAPLQEPAAARPQENDLLVRLDDERKTPLTPDDIPLGASQTMAWPMDPAAQVVRSGQRLNQVLLVRLDPAALTAVTRTQAAGGVVAYTAVCTHSGCDVDDWSTTDQLLSCSCHASVFDPKDNGKVVDGPAPRPLAALPLKLVDGRLVVAKPFTSPVGARG